MIIKNNTGGVASLGSVNAIDIPDGGTVDLSVLVDGLPLVTPSSIQSATELYLAIGAGDWAVIVDGSPLSIADALGSVTPCSQQEAATVGGRFENAWQKIAPNPGNGAWFDLPGCEWTVGDDQMIGVSAHVRVVAGEPAGSDVALTVSKLAGDSAELAEEDDRYGRVQGFDVKAYLDGSTARIRAKRGGSASVFIYSSGTASPPGDLS